MTSSHVNPAGRPTLAPLWTGHQSPTRLPLTAFRAAQGPLLSPSPMSPSGVPSAISPGSFDRVTRKIDRASGGGHIHKLHPLSASSPKSLMFAEGQSPLVSKLEEVSLQLTHPEKASSAKSPVDAQKDLGRDQMRHKFRPHEDYGNARTADAFVVARSIRRPNSPATEALHPFWEDDSTESKLPRRLTLRAIIRPKVSGRQTFLIQRNLNIDELRAAASTSGPDLYHQDTSPSKTNRKPLPVPAKWSTNSRRPSVGQHSPHAERSSRIMSHPKDYDKLIRDPKTIPIHLQYVIFTLPALAVLLTSGHVHYGDVLYLPVPHAESWSQTVHYAYTGEGELTTAMRENITYLGGRV